MKSKFLIAFILLFAGFLTLKAQNLPKEVGCASDGINHRTSDLLDMGYGHLMCVYSRYHNDTIKYLLSQSLDSGNSWLPSRVLFDTTLPGSKEDLLTSPFLLKGLSSRIFLFFKLSTTGRHYYKYSDDYGFSWSQAVMLNIGGSGLTGRDYRITSVVRRFYSELVLAISYKENSIGFVRSGNNGITFTQYELLTTGFCNPSLLEGSYGSMFMVFQEKGIGNTRLMSMQYDPSTNTWKDTSIILESQKVVQFPKLYKIYPDGIYVFYKQTDTVFGVFPRSNLYRIKSTDDGLSWTAPERMTGYFGSDDNLNINPQSASRTLIFSSNRKSGNTDYGLYWGRGNKLEDSETPPRILYSRILPATPLPGDSVFLKTYLGFEGSGYTVETFGNIDGAPFTQNLYDDGLHDDSIAGDHIYGGFLAYVGWGYNVTYYVRVITEQDTVISQQFNFVTGYWEGPDVVRLNTGRLSVSFNNSGVIADVTAGAQTGLLFDGQMAVFSHGFSLSGFIDGQLWASAVMSASRLADYQPGTVGGSQIAPLYRISQNDSAFGAGWLSWRDAVYLGARFWDGNGDGIYNPVDLNGNGKWDTTEDMPEILGEVSYFSVYNDGVPAHLRRFNIDPVGVEIRQTVYAWPSSEIPAIRDAIFVRYEIQRKWATNNIAELIFSVFDDGDLGDATDDLAGVDTSRRAAYIYNDGADAAYGDNPPAVFSTLILGAPLYIPGETYTDLNGNGVYDDGHDTPLDTAIMLFGTPFQNRLYPGARNSKLLSAGHYMQSHPTQGDPNTALELRHYHEGQDKIGQFIDPCTWSFGQVLGGVNCSLVNPVFMYSGDPVTQSGWINTTPLDQRVLVNSEKLTLHNNDTITFHTGIIIGRGNSSLNSVNLTRANLDSILQYLGLPVPVTTGVEENENTLPDKFFLYQNFPNPFNPSTLIKFDLPKDGDVKLVVFDLLGREVKTLVDGNMFAGKHSIEFNATSLASGVYLYRIETLGFSIVRKLVLVK